MGTGSYRITQRGSNARYLIELVDDKGKALLTSQYREQQPMCLNEVRWMRLSAPKDVMYERVDGEGAWSFVLHANDAHVLGHGPTFPDEASREEGIEAVKAVAADAELVDTTPELDLSTKFYGVLQDFARKTVAAQE